MGVTIQCKKTGRSIDLGYSGFFRLRRKVAELQGGPFLDVFQEIFNPHSDANEFTETTETPEQFDERMNLKIDSILSAKQADIKVVDFLLQPEVDGWIRYGACKNILKVIKDYDDNILYGYCGRRDCAKFADFRAILEDCVINKSDMVWS